MTGGELCGISKGLEQNQIILAFSSPSRASTHTKKEPTAISRGRVQFYTYTDRLCRSRLRLIFPHDRLADQSHADRLGAYLDPNDPAINHCAHALDVGLELSAGDAGNFRSDAAEIFGLPAMGHFVTKAGLFSGEIANAWHWNPLGLILKSRAL